MQLLGSWVGFFVVSDKGQAAFKVGIQVAFL
jgi:hypothetical protein